MKKTKIFSIFFFVSLFSIFISSCGNGANYLTSESDGTATIRIFKDNESTSKERFISPKKVKMKYSYTSLSGLLYETESVCPSIGNVNLLVIPVHIPGSTTYRTDAVREDIEKVFFGKKNDSDLGYVSISEYFKESSYNQLNFGGKVTDWFDVENYTSIKKASDVSNGEEGTIINEILPAAVKWAKETQKVNLKDYDKNGDGAIDAVWLVYDHFDYLTHAEQEYVNNGTIGEINYSFTNYTDWDYSTANASANEDPTTSGFSWVSISSMYKGYCFQDAYGFDVLKNLDSIKLDSHSYIKEACHLLGLEDYDAADDSSYHPAGVTTMMDSGVGDLDSYSKMLLGWITPYVVYGTSEILIPNVTSSNHGVIVIPSDFEKISNEIEIAIANGTIGQFTYEFNPFSEYIMIDLYSPDGLNYIDTFGTLTNGSEACIGSSGVRIYHIDSRIFKCEKLDYEGGQLLTYVDGYLWDEGELEESTIIFTPINNQKNEDQLYQLPEAYAFLDQIRLLEAHGINTFNNGKNAVEETLWTTSSEAFDIVNFGYQFFCGNYCFNDGNELPFKIKVETLKGVSL